MPKVVFVANSGWYLFNFRINTILHFLKNGYIVSLVCPGDVYSKKLVDRGCVHVDVGIRRRYFTVSSLFKFRSACRNSNIVFSFTPIANVFVGLVSFFNNFSWLPNISGLGQAYRNGGLPLFFVLLYRVFLRHATRVIFQNEDDMNFFIRNDIVVRGKCIRVYGSGVDLSLFSPSSMPPSSPRRFLMASRVREDKGVLLFLEAAIALKSKYGHSVDFQLAGGFDTKNIELIDLVQKCSAEGVVTFHGHVDDVHELLKCSHACILPSMYREGVPKILLETAAMGRIVITTDTAGCRDTVIDEVTGYIIRDPHVSEVIGAMERVIVANIEDLRRLGSAAHELAASKFNERDIILLYYNCAEGIL